MTIEVDDELFARARQLAEAREITVTEMLKRLLRIAAAPPLARSCPFGKRV
jgi:predicted transcriptional regulator